jgi:hypothetical protein
MAPYDQWLEAFKRAYRAPDQTAGLACPNCGACKLQLRFVTYGGREDRASAVFWCDSCLEGMPPRPSQVPAGCATVRHEDAGIPNYRVALPTGWGGSRRTEAWK